MFECFAEKVGLPVTLISLQTRSLISQHPSKHSNKTFLSKYQTFITGMPLLRPGTMDFPNRVDGKQTEMKVVWQRNALYSLQSGAESPIPCSLGIT